MGVAAESLQVSAESLQLSVRKSTVSGAGLGLFTDKDIDEFAILGEYSGALLSYMELGQKMKAVGKDDLYPFHVAPGRVVDPTEVNGELAADSLSMAFINEPPVGTAYNTIFVYSKLPTEHAVSRVFAVARCKVPAGSELFVCYAYEMHRGYEFEPPDVEDDNAIRKRIALRHPELSTNYGCSMMQDEYQE
eukprot:gnl/TRDRNA2_/TRDRNA2_95514_c0_seq1.p1 gnl/TRDRNA2_/TRDRNA2_95514_c0~~gnl/TRDRNA2_/TRDRNA2_95514_c0_seq1.p1  ORF type:complete len:191 (-),score=25.02 gnl/TRDRNA2_/TRDRNA2_95514_c0_seq1:26-598(-)